MKKTIDYMNWSTDIFDGFYESMLYNSDMLYDNPYTCDIELPEGYSWDIYDFQGYMKEVGQEAVNLLDAELSASWHDDGRVVIGMKFVGISSPKYYNFSTDRICAEVEVNYEELNRYCLLYNRDDFDNYLRENFSDRDGFWSFIPNNVKDFEDDLTEFADTDDKYDNVMLEYYLLNLDYVKERPHDFSEYKSDLYEQVDEILSNYICLEKDGKYYDYSYAEDGDTVVVGDRIDLKVYVKEN